jgi:serine/threonine protein phosphatase PrpC
MLLISDYSCFTSICKREINEDAFGIIDEKSFLLCDGVGGIEHGEIASQLLINIFKKSITKYNSKNHEFFDRILEMYDSFCKENLLLSSMASTLTFSKLQENSILVAWCGDSRVYHIRNGEVLFETIDHNWVNEALKFGILSFEESLDHPNRNIITRAIKYQSKSSIIEIHQLTNLEDGDFIFHCSDGVLESWSNVQLMNLFSNNFTCNEYIDSIKKKCEIYSQDNSTALLYKIKFI